MGIKVLVACEYSGIVRDSFISKGHDAVSCDLLDTESKGPHIKGDIMDVDLTGYDIIIAHPPCTYLSVSGNRSYGPQSDKHYLRINAAKWTRDFWDKCVSVCDRVCFENPVGQLRKLAGFHKPQYVEPWMFGHPETKKTGLWLHGLPYLKPTDEVEPEYITCSRGKRYSPTHWYSPNKDRGKFRSKTYKGVAEAMALQWGRSVTHGY